MYNLKNDDTARMLVESFWRGVGVKSNSRWVAPDDYEEFFDEQIDVMYLHMVVSNRVREVIEDEHA